MKPGGLGRGLASLIPTKKFEGTGTGVNFAFQDDGEVVVTGNVMNIPVDNIDRNPEQPRRDFNEADLQDLAQSIREHGILQPLLVSKTGERYTLIAGERRLRASKRAGLLEVPCLVRQDVTNKEQLELAIIENVQRENLNPLDQAAAYYKLHNEFGLSHEQIAKQVGKERPTISNMIRILGLPEEIRQAIKDNKINYTEARALLMAENSEQQKDMFEKTLTGKMSSQEVAHKTKRVKVQSHTRSVQKDPQLAAYENEIARLLGTRVRIKSFGESGGNIIIEYYSPEELSGIVEKIVKE